MLKVLLVAGAVLAALAVSPVAGADTKVFTATYPPLTPMPSVQQGIADAGTDRTCGIECQAGYGFCQNLLVINENYGYNNPGGYDLRLQVYYCSNNFVIGTTCTRRRWVQKTDAPWEFIQWMDWQLIGGPGQTRCGAWTQGHTKGTWVWWPDDNDYPCLRVIGWANNPSNKLNDWSCTP